MKKLFLITTIALATMAAAPAPSKETAAAQQGMTAAQQVSDGGTTTPPGAAAPEKKICKLLPSTGTRMSKSACLTAKEWKQVQAEVEGDNGF
jgi:hypothetical protein